MNGYVELTFFKGMIVNTTYLLEEKNNKLKFTIYLYSEKKNLTLNNNPYSLAFLVVGPLRFYPPYTNGLVVNATFFSFCL